MSKIELKYEEYGKIKKFHRGIQTILTSKTNEKTT